MTTSLFSYRPYWAHRFGIAPFLPMSPQEMEELGWECCDIILITGDAYIDHPSFGMALIGRLLEAQGFRVGVIAQPNWKSVEDFTVLGQPNLFFGITAGNMDSMVNHYTSDRKIRRDDAYTPHGVAGHRPDRAAIVYAQRCREAYPDVPIVLGGIEASLRRLAHYDYWSDKVRRSILLDSKADILLYGNAERAVVALAHRLARGEDIAHMTDLRGSVIVREQLPQEWTEIDCTTLDTSSSQSIKRDQPAYLRLPSYEQVQTHPTLYAHASRLFHLESNPHNARPLVQRHGTREVWVNPPPIPLTTEEMDKVYELPYARLPHPCYQGTNIPAYEMIRFSVTIMRGCFGGCTFCSLTEHEGRLIQNRSVDSILREIETLRDQTPGFTGIISDLGGPTANMYRLGCRDQEVQSRCRKLSCVSPKICKYLHTSHTELVHLYRQVRKINKVKKVFVASGVRYDLAVTSPEYIKELATYHVGGYLKIAPEHTEAGPLSKMLKPGIESYEQFKTLFDNYSRQAGKEQYLIPYFIAAHPGTTEKDMLNLALWLKRNGFRLEQTQVFLPTPMSLATAMYHSSKNPLNPIQGQKEDIVVPKGLKMRRLHKAFLRYHDPENWPLLREALRKMGRSDLIGPGKRFLVPK